MGLEIAKKVIDKAIKEIKNSEEYRLSDTRREVLDISIHNLESVKESLDIDTEFIRKVIEKAINKHAKEEDGVELIMYFSYDSIYPHASIVSDELDFDELYDLSDKVTKEVYTEEFPFVVTATNRG